jgi:hypothetical protein
MTWAVWRIHHRGPHTDGDELFWEFILVANSQPAQLGWGTKKVAETDDIQAALAALRLMNTPVFH